MKVFVSSTSRDLADHRAAAIRALRRLGHEVVAMEEFTAAPAFPLDRVLRLVRESDAYVVIVAWRYGFVPDASRAAGLPEVPDGRQADQISITEWEYLVAREYPGGENRVRPGQEREPSERPILPFILAESAPWPPQEMDGFNPHATGDPGSLDRIRAFRATLTSDHVVSFFSRPEDLEALVSAAITSARLSRGVQVNRIRVGDPVQGGLTTPDSDYAGGLIDVVGRSGTDSVVTIDIATAWWSTRLYLLAFLLDRLTGVRRILVVDNGSFVGLLPVGTIVRFVPSIHEPVTRFEAAATARLDSEPDVTREAQALIALFKSCFATDPREPNPGGQPGAAKQGPASRGAGRRSRATTSVAPPDPETTMDQETRHGRRSTPRSWTSPAATCPDGSKTRSSPARFAWTASTGCSRSTWSGSSTTPVTSFR